MHELQYIVLFFYLHFVPFRIITEFDNFPHIIKIADISYEQNAQDNNSSAQDLRAP